MKQCKACGEYDPHVIIKRVVEGADEFEVKVCSECMEEAIFNDKTYAEWLDELESEEADRWIDEEKL